MPTFQLLSRLLRLGTALPVRHAAGFTSAYLFTAAPLSGVRTFRRAPSAAQRLLALALVGLGAIAASPALVQAAPADGICRVAPAPVGTALASGADWLNPVALDTALANTGCAEIWARYGKYTPMVEMQPATLPATAAQLAHATRTKAFAINRPLKLYGGFAGTESSLAARVLRPSQATVLSGDLNGNDAVGTAVSALASDATRADNSYHVVVMGGLDVGEGNGTYTATNTVLDGLTITAGQANGALPHNRGGGLLCSGNGAGKSCSPTISNATFSGNSANGGGAIYNYGSSPTISNATFSGNSAGYGGAISNNYNSSPTISNATFSGNSANGGGAIYNYGSSPTISNATFSGNSASYGGAIYNYDSSSPTISNVTFSGNSANNYGGAIYNFWNNIPTISNATFSENFANYGGAIYSDISSPTISNATFSGNSANEGGAVYNTYYSTTTITASILWGNGATPITNYDSSVPTFNHSIVQGSGGSTSWNPSFGTNGGGNLDADPLLSPLGDHGGPTHTMLPAVTSPAITTGYTCTAASGTDQRGVARPASGNQCHIGAVQRVLTPSQLTVTTSGSGLGTVSSLPAGISNCTSLPATSGTCSASLADAVTLTATPAADSHFTGWSGTGASACTSTASTCTVVMDAAKTIQAQFGFVANVATGSGTVTLRMSDAQCTLAASSPTHSPTPTRPLLAGYTALDYGQIGFTANNCTPGGTLSVSLTMPSALPANTKLLKWNGSAWVPWAATVSGSTITYAIVDNTGAGGSFGGDTNPAAGVIDDPVVMALAAAAAGTVAVPTLSQWALLVLALLLGTLTAQRLRRQR